MDLTDIRPSKDLGSRVWQPRMYSVQYSIQKKEEEKKAFVMLADFKHCDVDFSHSKYIFLVKFVGIRSTNQAYFKVAVFEST